MKSPTPTVAEKDGATTEPLAEKDEQETQDGQAAQKSLDTELKDDSTTASISDPVSPPAPTTAAPADEDTIVVAPAKKASSQGEKPETVPDSEAATESEDAEKQDSLIVKLPVTLKSEEQKQVERMLVKLPISVPRTEMPGERVGTWQ